MEANAIDLLSQTIIGPSSRRPPFLQCLVPGSLLGSQETICFLALFFCLSTIQFNVYRTSAYHIPCVFMALVNIFSNSSYILSSITPPPPWHAHALSNRIVQSEFKGKTNPCMVILGQWTRNRSLGNSAICCTLHYIEPVANTTLARRP